MNAQHTRIANITKAVCLANVLLGIGLSARGAERDIFQGQTDIGGPSKSGSGLFEPGSGSYTLAGGGENMWFTNDAFHFMWTRVSGDLALHASIEWLTAGGNAHRKACLMVRQSLDPNSAYVDVAVHGDGLTSLQFRETAGGLTHEIQAGISPDAKAGIGIQRQGETFFMELPDSGAQSSSGSNKAVMHWAPSGQFKRVKFSDPVYVGLAVCAHDDRVLEKARFSQVALASIATVEKPKLHCALETISIASGDRQVVYHAEEHIEAPNWSHDGRWLLFNSSGHIYRVPVGGGKPEKIDTGFAVRCNNDHGLSPDGSRLVISDQTRGGKSLIYLVNLTSPGTEPRLVTPLGPSYWHGWSPDGASLAYCAERNGEFDVYSIPAEGGQESRLTTAKGLDDGPEYSADGKYIYFNSDRTGAMQIWRMKPDGSQQEQITNDEYNNWFPHPSPDSKWLVFLSYERAVSGHPANQPVRLRAMPLVGGAMQELAKLFGGQGTINVPSWSPDSRKFAFVSYELISR
jgi:TolB protein